MEQNAKYKKTLGSDNELSKLAAIPLGFLFKYNTSAACVASRKGQEEDSAQGMLRWVGGKIKPVLFQTEEAVFEQ